MRAPIAILALGLLFSNTPARAFEGEVHSAITHQVLEGLNYRESSIDAVIAGNLQTDKDEFNDPAAHFDNETFEGGSSRLRAKIDAAVAATLACDRAAALENMGRALHATQDFFAHSNFVERGDDLKKLDLLHMVNPDPATVCQPPFFKGPLTTGYWPDDHRPFPYKCIHAELNKDAPLDEPRFVQARAAARAESREIVLLIEKRLRDAFPDRGEADAVIDYLRLGPIALEGTRLTCPSLQASHATAESCLPTIPVVLDNAGLTLLNGLSGF